MKKIRDFEFLCAHDSTSITYIDLTAPNPRPVAALVDRPSANQFEPSPDYCLGLRLFEPDIRITDLQSSVFFGCGKVT